MVLHHHCPSHIDVERRHWDVLLKLLLVLLVLLLRLLTLRTKSLLQLLALLLVKHLRIPALHRRQQCSRARPTDVPPARVFAKSALCREVRASDSIYRFTD